MTTRQYNRNFFYWGCEPGEVIIYPTDDAMAENFIRWVIKPRLEEIDKLMEQWKAGHRSYGRSHCATILTQDKPCSRLLRKTSRDIDKYCTRSLTNNVNKTKSKARELLH